ncbi:MAG: M56 family metallopeptidase [Pseudomonadales bacterium]|nr:M56 family metallopeptidase [Pseudomonadales bacterium]
MPLIGSLVVGAMISIPALTHISTLPIDHCHDLNGCIGPPASHMATTGELAVISIVFSLLFVGMTTAFWQWRRTHMLLNQLDIASQTILAPNIQLIEAGLPLAFSLGVFKPRAVLSTGLVNRLTSQQLHIVCAHEAKHIHYRDGLYKWLLCFMCSFHWPGVKRALLKEHVISLEIRADQQVALNIQNPIAVAETIVTVQRLMGPTMIDEPLCQFIGSELEQRVHYLLAKTPDSALPKYSASLGFIGSLVLAVCGSVPLHNTIEALISP